MGSDSAGSVSAPRARINSPGIRRHHRLTDYGPARHRAPLVEARSWREIPHHDLIVVQASAERRLLGSGQQRTADVLATIEDAGRESLGELRRLRECCVPALSRPP
ncbi:MAG TPA: hypothetical protein VE570_12130 [Thermoleophilaceae bacterium]|jgi:hypothetical protein|nr:hypothetical protein [Thermoleophilaceae bacterium]